MACAVGGAAERVSGRLSADREVINLAALGFTGFPGIPSVIGPFNVFDARIGVSQPVIDSAGALSSPRDKSRADGGAAQFPERS